MKLIEITAKTRRNGLVEKTVTLPVPDECGQWICELFAKRAADAANGTENRDRSEGFVVDGDKRIGIRISILDHTETL
ncbi:MAG: hypothetical protein LIP02_04125 [Bacteroidales bacterium]|nr:hypothetical protein [Bacteroidales bacterium]